MPDPKSVRWAGVVLSVGVAVWFLVWVTVRGTSQFYTDDFLYLQQGATDHITWSWLAQSSYGHFAPVFKLIYAFVARVGGLDWPLAAGVLALLDTLIYLSLAWLATTLMGRRPVAIVVAAAAAVSVPAIRTSLWMASGVQVLGGAFCMALCVAGFVAFLRAGRRYALVVSLGALALGLVWYERPILTIGYLVLIRYLFLRPARAGSIGRFLAKEALLWTPYLIEAAIYLVYRLFIFDSSPVPGSASSTAELFGSGVTRSYLPSLVGARLGEDSTWLELPAALGGLVLLAAFALLAVYRRGVWRCAVFLIATYGANVVVQAAGRLGVAGANPVSLSRDLQYFVDPYVATVIALLLAATLPPREPRPALARYAPPAAAGVAAAIAVSTCFGWVSVMDHAMEASSHTYLDHALGDLKRPGTVDLVSLKIPPSVAFPFIDPFTDQGYLFGIDPELSRHLDPASPRTVILTSDGDLVAVHPVTLETFVPTRQHARKAPARAAAASGGVCVSGPAGTHVTVPLTVQPPVAGASAVQITYTTPAKTRLELGTSAGFNQRPTDLLPGGQREVIARLDAEPTGVLSLMAKTSVQDLCIKSVWVGMLAVDTPDGCRVVDHYGAATQVPADCTKSWPAR